MRSLKVVSPKDMVNGEWYRCLLIHSNEFVDEWYFQFSHYVENSVYAIRCYSFMDDGYVFHIDVCRDFCNKGSIKKNSLKGVNFKVIKEKFNIL